MSSHVVNGGVRAQAKKSVAAEEEEGLVKAPVRAAIIADEHADGRSKQAEGMVEETTNGGFWRLKEISEIPKPPRWSVRRVRNQWPSIS